MNKTLLLKKSVYLSICALVCLSPNKLIAASCEPSIAKHPPGVEPPNYYGNAQTDSFRCAINGGKDLTLAQINERAALIPEKVTNRFYIRGGLNGSSEGVVGLKNKALINTGTNNFVLGAKKFNTSSNNFELGFGYTWSDFAIDVEWLSLTTVNFSSTLTGSGSTVDFNGTLFGDSYLSNFYWNFKNLYNFNLYAVGVFGFTNNKTTTTISGGSVTSGQPNIINRMFAMSFGAGVGARFNIISNIYADMAARYLYLGSANFQAVSGDSSTSVSLRGSRRWIGISIRLLWLL